MGFAVGNSNAKQKTLYIANLKGVGQDDSYPYFTMLKSEKVGDKYIYEEAVPEVKEIFGVFKSASISKKFLEDKGIDSYKFKIFLEDDEDVIMVSGGLNDLSRTMFNCLLGTESQISDSKVHFSLYTKDGYKKVSCTYNYVDSNNRGERMEWLWDIEAQKSMVEEIKNKTGKVMQRDKTEFNEKIMELVNKNFASKKDLVGELEDLASANDTKVTREVMKGETETPF